MHLIASRASERNGREKIPQSALSMTQFGFMGFALIKPHVLGILHDKKEDREAFVHFWAVIASMLGVKDEFNMCLNSLEVVESSVNPVFFLNLPFYHFFFLLESLTLYLDTFSPLTYNLKLRRSKSSGKRLPMA